ncbi:MAG TPA: DUF4145 domain-containing protein [Solirubrobacterales bacterium]|nr:DUF4145 domain-containing protein [Solirubrobacterales bacterium]
MAEHKVQTESEETPAEQLASEGEHIAPHLDGTSFHCMYCGVLAQQFWSHLMTDSGSRMGGQVYVGYSRCTCRNCQGTSIWNEAEKRCVDPVIGGGPRPHVDMPEDVKADYDEARRIISQSPRGACGLLRLAVQKLCKDLGEKGENINEDIKSLVQKGLPEEVQEAMDSLRVIGNNAVHPGEMDLRDDTETASALFNLLNFVVEEMIAKPKRRRGVFEKLPVSVREAIKRRDGK